MTATVLGVTALRTASRSPSGTFGKPDTFGWNKVSQPGFPDAAMVASVRPWNPCSMVTISKAPPRCRLPHFRASLMAPSLASAPLLHRKTSSSPVLSAMSVASLAMGSL